MEEFPPDFPVDEGQHAACWLRESEGAVVSAAGDD
jgi:hypothetical protein